MSGRSVISTDQTDGHYFSILVYSTDFQFGPKSLRNLKSLLFTNPSGEKYFCFLSQLSMETGKVIPRKKCMTVQIHLEVDTVEHPSGCRHIHTVNT